MANNIVKQLIDKTFSELAKAEEPIEQSRISNTPNGYVHLITWSNANLLRVLVVKFTTNLSKSFYRLKSQIDDAARSVIANIEEGFSRPTTSEYLNFLGFSQASLIEVKGDIERSRQDGILKSISGTNLVTLGINLSEWHTALKKSVISKPFKGVYRNLEEVNKEKQYNKFLQNPLNSSNNSPEIYTAVADGTPSTFKFNYLPVDSLQTNNLTYEIFIELINKTNWHLRRLVESLENKLNRDQKFYQVEKARLRSNLKIKY